jgi:hypothetical protein
VAEIAIRCQWGMEIWGLAMDLVPLLKHGVNLRAINSNADFELNCGAFPLRKLGIKPLKKNCISIFLGHI